MGERKRKFSSFLIPYFFFISSFSFPLLFFFEEVERKIRGRNYFSFSPFSFSLFRGGRRRKEKIFFFLFLLFFSFWGGRGGWRKRKTFLSSSIFFFLLILKFLDIVVTHGTFPFSFKKNHFSFP